MLKTPTELFPEALFLYGKLYVFRKQSNIGATPLGLTFEFEVAEHRLKAGLAPEDTLSLCPEVDLLCIHWSSERKRLKMKRANIWRFQIVALPRDAGYLLFEGYENLKDLCTNYRDKGPRDMKCVKVLHLWQAVQYLDDNHLVPMFDAGLKTLKVGVVGERAEVIGFFLGDCWNWTNRGFCKFRKTSCRYVHDMGRRASKGDARRPCVKFERGQCFRGKNCDYKHPEMSSDSD